MEGDLLFIFTVRIEVVLLDKAGLLEDLEVVATNLEGESEEEVSYFDRGAFNLLVPLFILKHLEELDLFTDCLLEHLTLSLACALGFQCTPVAFLVYV